MVARPRRVLAPGHLAAADRDLRRPGREPRLRVRALHGAVPGRLERDTNVIGRVAAGSPAAAAHSSPATGPRVAGQTVAARRHPGAHPRDGGAPFKLLVERNGKRVSLGPLRAKQENGAYRIGIAIEARTGPGESLPAASGDALRLTWGITSDTVRGIGHLATGRDTNQVSSSVGIVRVSAQAWRQGARDFLFVLGLVSLALGLLNLLPVLPLDGGHIVMALVEKVRGQHVPPGGLHPLHRGRADAVRGADVLRAAQRPLRRRRLDGSEHAVERAGDVRERQRLDEQRCVADLPAPAATHEAP